MFIVGIFVVVLVLLIIEGSTIVAVCKVKEGIVPDLDECDNDDAEGWRVVSLTCTVNEPYCRVFDSEDEIFSMVLYVSAEKLFAARTAVDVADEEEDDGNNIGKTSLITLEVEEDGLVPGINRGTDRGIFTDDDTLSDDEKEEEAEEDDEEDDKPLSL